MDGIAAPLLVPGSWEAGPPQTDRTRHALDRLGCGWLCAGSCLVESSDAGERSIMVVGGVSGGGDLSGPKSKITLARARRRRPPPPPDREAAPHATHLTPGARENKIISSTGIE